MKEGKRITLKDVAKLANVSVSAASLGLRNSSSLAPETVLRIQEAAEELGYVRNPILSSLASQRFRGDSAVNAIPVAILSFPTLGKADSRSPNYIEALVAGLAKLGYGPKVIEGAPVGNPSEFLSALYEKGFQGIIITGQPEACWFSDQVLWRSFCIVQCGRFRTSSPLHTVRPNVTLAIRLLYRSLRDLGYRRVGFAFGVHEPIVEDDKARLGTVKAVQRLRDADADHLRPFSGQIGDLSGIMEWVREVKPDVVAGFNVRTYFALRDAGFRIPEDIGFASLHLKPGESDVYAGIDQNKVEVARQSCILLDKLIRFNERGIPKVPRELLIAPSWVQAGTVRLHE